MNTIFIIRDQQVEGPLSKREIDGMLRTKQITAKTPAQVRSPGLAEGSLIWQPLQDAVRELDQASPQPRATFTEASPRQPHGSTHFGDVRDLRAGQAATPPSASR